MQGAAGVQMQTKKDSGTGKKGGQYGNVNAQKHGAFASLTNLDQRTQLAKGLRALREDLNNALGGNLSPQESLLVDRCVYKSARIAAWEAYTLNGGEPSETDAHYLAWANSLRLDLQALGLQRRAAPVESLRDYLDHHDEGNINPQTQEAPKDRD